jgi:serine/threonine protein kinase
LVNAVLQSTPDISVETRIGTEVGGYRIESVIGRGGMGVVYLADHLRLKRKVALKLLAPELAQDELFRERFVRESELAASLEHPNIVPIYDAGEAEGLLYIAMRFVEGTDLKNLIEREGPLRPDRAATIIEQVAAALDAAHGKGLIHRDVKPANVLLDRADHAYLTDFGLTKRPDQTTGLTKTGQFMGSVDYAAPEQFEGKPLDGRTDVYSLGCVAFECLTGRVPYSRETEAAVMFAHIKDPAPMPSAIRPELGAGLDAVLSRAMAKTPDRRYATAGAFAEDLREAVRPRPSTRGRPVGPRPNRRTLALIGGGVAAAITVILVVVAVAGGGRGPTDSGSTPTGSPPTGSPSTVVAGAGAALRVDPTTNRVIARAGPHGFVTVGGGFVWIATVDGLEKINAQSNTVVAHIDLRPSDMIFGDGSLWVTVSEGALFPPVGERIVRGSLFRVDPRTNEYSKLATIPTRSLSFVKLFINTTAVEDGSIWVVVKTPGGKGYLVQYDALTGERVRKILLPDPPDGLAFGEDSLWIRSTSPAPSIVRIDPRTGELTKRIDVGGADGLAVGAGAVWVSDSSNDVVVRIDPATNTLAGQVTQGLSTPQAITAADDRVWVSNLRSCSVARINPVTNRVEASIPVTTRSLFFSVADGPEGVWIGGYAGPEGCS